MKTKFEQLLEAELSAESRTASPEQLAIMATDERASVRVRVANNWNTSPETLAKLAKDYIDVVRMAVAENPKTSPEVLADLANSQNKMLARIASRETEKRAGVGWHAQSAKEQPLPFTVRWKAAGSLAALPEQLAAMAADEDETVRRRVADNPNTSPETLAKLAKDSDDVVRIAVAENPKTSHEVLADPANSQDKVVARIASEEMEKRAGVGVTSQQQAKIPSKIGNIEITPEQRQALQEGKSVALSGLVDKTGKVRNTTHVTFDKETSKVRLMEEKVSPPKQQVKAAPSTPAAKKGLRM